MNENINTEKEFIRNIAVRIHESGFITPAVFFLELSKPLSLIGSHAMIFFGPIINAFINTEGYYKAAEIFEKPENVELLIQEIENFEEKIIHAER
ncbi:MAG: hypothetical protein ACJZ1O_01355 [Candidatus Neomarinimicrobiota bacterium]|nr:MAG: hypothetical protein EVA23_02250 [bacterium]|tara:strand:+ start:3127 stop:3411 length:285 start_codon:yes stop_codon:yes gene_type:complete